MMIGSEIAAIKQRPTKRAPDAGESGDLSSIFLRLIIFPVGRLHRPPAPARVTQTVGCFLHYWRTDQKTITSWRIDIYDEQSLS